jgi:quinol-cytochrome oxidoreductase complex cytochrome b subunit
VRNLLARRTAPSKDGGIIKRQHTFAAFMAVLGVWATDAPGTNVSSTVSLRSLMVRRRFFFFFFAVLTGIP